MSDIVVRLQTAADDEACAWLWQRASQKMRRDHGLPWLEPTAEVARVLHCRFAHVRSTDPSGCVVAEVHDEVVGLAHALVRDGLWTCSLFGVDPAWQSRGIGKRMLERVLAYGDPSRGRCSWPPPPGHRPAAPARGAPRERRSAGRGGVDHRGPGRGCAMSSTFRRSHPYAAHLEAFPPHVARRLRRSSG